MTRLQAKELWDRWQWLVAVILLPLVLWAGKKYDATKLDAQVFVRYVDRQQADQTLREVRDSARQEGISRQLRYLICREDFSRQQCLRPDR